MTGRGDDGCVQEQLHLLVFVFLRYQILWTGLDMDLSPPSWEVLESLQLICSGDQNFFTLLNRKRDAKKRKKPSAEFLLGSISLISI